jgi:probable F420-dependent oxidoreductase
MQIGVCLPHYGQAMDPAGMRTFAERVESLGFDSIWVTDHVIVPKGLDIIYKERMLDPLATLSYLAGVTNTVRLGTSVLILPYRNPVIVAKELATTDVLSGGRVIFGAASGWMEGEFAALGADFANRGAVTDEYLQIITAIWSRAEPEVKTEHFDIRGVVASPEPAQRPRPPIWIGGQSPPAARRAIAFGDVWHPNLPSWEVVEGATRYLAELSAKAGRAQPPRLATRAAVNFDVPPPEGARPGLFGAPEQMAATARRFEAAGVSHLLLNWRDMPFVDVLAEMERFGTEVLPQAR